jgi:hypothetical protein
MLVQLATIPGRDDRPNEDFPAALPDCAVLLDGAGGPAEMPTLHAGTCDLSDPGTPSTTVVMARLRPDAVEYLVLGDSTLLIDRDGQEPVVLTDQRIEEVAVAEQDAMKALPTGTPEHFAARVRFVGRQRGQGGEGDRVRVKAR